MINKIFDEIINDFRCERYKDIESEFSSEIRELFKIDKYAQIALMNYSMANFYPLINDLVNTIRPKSICEIGVDTGFTTFILNDICKNFDGRLHAVDPVLDENNLPVKSDLITYHIEKSETYLEREIYNRVYFIDAEHTYDALYNELNTIHKINSKCRKNSIIFVHDMSWPHSYRDVIYNPDDYKHKDRPRDKGYLFPTSSDFCDYGMPMFYADVAAYEGGKNNGLLKAVQDFIEENEEYEFCKIPSQYGFGIIWNKNEDVDVLNQIEVVKEMFKKIHPFLGLLELNRFLLISRIEYLKINNFRLNEMITNKIESLENSKSKIIEFDDIIKNLEIENLDLKSKNLELMEEIKKIFNSKSFKITRPFRVIFSLFRK
ncbi:class I SAM-dependent methyltransferase [Vibrio gazogenes]|uniref:Methyltransferase domain-containing protein n=1 Tax=Vibrio gazogenes TaxID=687 RepID=A0A1Z2SFE4_VIBGA|nr:class I SAM-dependent methyltransferase [Vibrio gazogenes]ASA55899.1 hypothetical protein BSQ33_09480 [Vibrio gazogenes]